MCGLEELQEEGAVNGKSRGPCVQKCTRDEESQLFGLEDAGFNDFIDGFNAGGDGHVSSGSA